MKSLSRHRATGAESKLFGTQPDGLSCAVTLTSGRIEAAHRSTLFLEWIDDLPQWLQVKLTRWLRNEAIERIGGAAVSPR